jgi:hypothetical protein
MGDGDLDALLANMDEARRVEAKRLARDMLDEPRGAFPMSTMLLMARMAHGATIPTHRESQRLAAAWGRWRRRKRA